VLYYKSGGKRGSVEPHQHHISSLHTTLSFNHLNNCPQPLDKPTIMRYTKTMNETTPTLDELQLIEDESTTDSIHSDLSGDDYADAMLKELGCVSTHLGL
jgi:hypothetical protein